MNGELTSWTKDPSKLADTCRSLEGDMTSDRNLMESLIANYYQRPFAVSSASDRATILYNLGADNTLSSQGYNLTREVIDASAAQMCRPLRAKVLPVGADFETQRAARKLSRLVDGVMESANYMDHATQAYVDAATTSVGAVKWYSDTTTKEIKCERVDPTRILWHYDEGRNPIHLYTVEAVPKAALKAHFPGHAIDELQPWKPMPISGVDPIGIRGTECVRVNEAWRKKVGDQPGRHVISTDNFVLVDEEWNHDFFPLAVIRWAPEFRSFGGVSLARLVAPYHTWRNELLMKVRESLDGAVPWLLAHEDSQVSTVGDVAHQLVRWSGPTPPTLVAQNPVSPQLLKQIMDIHDAAFAECGLNQQAAQGTRPAGLNSAPSQREWVDIVNMRLLLQQRGWENLARDSARNIVALAADTYKTRGARVRAPGTDFLEEIRWSDIRLKEDQYRMVFGLASGLSATTSGRIEQLMMLKEAGAIDTADVLRHIDLPDVEQLSDRINAPRDLAEKQIAKALEDGEFDMPSALQPLDPLIAIGAQEYQRALLSGVYPPAHVEVLRKLIAAARERQAKAAQAAPVAAPPTAPPLAPMPTEGGTAPLPSDVPMPEAPPAAAMDAVAPVA